MGLGYMRCFKILQIFATFQLVQSRDDCCRAFDSSTYEELNVTEEFNTFPVGDGWELSVNISWIPAPDYDGYDIDLELASTPEVNPLVCSSKNRSCLTETESSGTWREFKQLQFGSVYIIKIYISEVADDVRGNYVTGVTAVSPDCYDVTRSTDFCINQPVGYIGKPFDITLSDFKRFDKTHVLVNVTWRQPIHANPETPLVLYFISWANQVDADWTVLKNIIYRPGEYMTTELKPLDEDTTYTLTIVPGLLVNGKHEVHGVASTSFTTHLQADLGDANCNNVPPASFICFIQFFILKWMI